MRVLLVDDERDTTRVFSKLLTRAGHEVRTVGDGESALALTIQFQPDVVLLDLVLPGMDGHEVARRLRSKLNGQAPRLIAVSGCDPESVQVDRATFDGRLTKPVQIAEVLRVIEMVVGSGQEQHRDLRAASDGTAADGHTGRSVTAG